MSDYLDSYMKQCREQKKQAAIARRALIRELRSAGVERVEVEFDGYGDSGSIEGMEFTPNVENIEEKEVPDTAFEFTEWREGKPKKVKRNKTVSELIDDVCYGILGSEHGGWEINEGSFGTFIFRVDDDKVLVTFNQRIESVETSEEEY